MRPATTEWILEGDIRSCLCGKRWIWRAAESLTGKKLEIIRTATQHNYPVADIDGMLAEIEAGYGTGAGP
jgi:hypothetical protein